MDQVGVGPVVRMEGVVIKAALLVIATLVVKILVAVIVQ